MLVKQVSPSDLHNAYAQSRCPVCVLNDRDERRYIDYTLYDQVTNVHWRAQIRNARGFCAAHTTRILEEGRSALGVALIADDLIKTLQEGIGPAQSAASRGWLRGAFGGAGRAIAAKIRPTGACPLCGHLVQQTPVHLRSLLQDLATEEGARLYVDSAGLCVTHLVQTLDIGDPADGIAPLIARQKIVWSALEAELQEFIRKNDYQYTGEPSGEERDAWRRAFRLLAGWETGQQLR